MAFIQIFLRMSASSSVGSPAAEKMRQRRPHLREVPPRHSPMKDIKFVWMREMPGPSMLAPCRVWTPRTRSAPPRTSAITSSLPRPFWKDTATDSRWKRCFADSTAARVSVALHCTMTTSKVPRLFTSEVALTFSVRSPPTPTSLRPFLLMASTCSCHVSTKVTSRPPSARMPPKRQPMAPAPSTATVGLAPQSIHLSVTASRTRAISPAHVK
mmetsp:Transcript_56268/g.174544  ORF Transcript_56268/g.174544 Transcript_56268/m.174544 type:complete len:213 (+) Transcript_56268:595-1233(+)